MTDLCEVIITAPDAEWLAEFTRRLVADRLCAGAHQTSSIRSIYTWDGEIVERGEARVALHTRAEHVEAIIQRTDSEHPYEVPCVVALPITGINPTYADWVASATRRAIE